jgi:hypothetical protein
VKRNDPNFNAVVEQAIYDYSQGTPLMEVAKRYSIDSKKLTPILKQRGIHRDAKAAAALYIPRTSKLKRIELPIEEICQRYQQGETELSLAKAFGVSRPVIVRRLEEFGIVRRTQGETNRLLIASRTSEQRQAYSKAAHDAVRGTHATFETKCKNALTRQERQLGISPAEQLLHRWLIDRGVESIPQKAIGPYNADLAIDHTAIEIYGGGWHASGHHIKRAAERRRYLIESGYSILIIWVDGRKWPLSHYVADYIVSFISQHHNPTTHVLNGKGEEFSPENAYYKKAIGDI